MTAIAWPRSTWLALLTVLLPAPAGAQPATLWHVVGDVSSHQFEMDCRFEPQGARLGGTCTETGGTDSHVRPGTIHKLSQVSLSGTQIHWAYPVRVMFMSLDLAFDGTVAGNTMAGTISVAGHKGRFTALRS